MQSSAKLPEKFPNFVLFKTADGKVNIIGELDKIMVRANIAHTNLKVSEEQI